MLLIHPLEKNILYSGGFLPIITPPTRVPDTLSLISTWIDHFWVTFGAQFLPGVNENTITDHKLIFLWYRNTTENRNSSEKKISRPFQSKLSTFLKLYSWLYSWFIFLWQLRSWNSYYYSFIIRKNNIPWSDQYLINQSKI